MYEYQKEFLEYTSRSNRASAHVIASTILARLPVRSVVDFGCAQGGWLAEWSRLGIRDLVGLDGHYVDRTRLLIDAAHFMATDLHRPIRLDRRFDLVESLEVAEHLDAASAETFIGSLVAHGSVVLFSAATPGQGGDHHVNEQPYEYWRDIFNKYDFELFDCIRPAILDHPQVNPWYRYNVMLYVHRQSVSSLPPEWVATHLPRHRPIPDLTPWRERLKKEVIRRMPDALENFLARQVARRHASG
ncbi:MAG: hypothetical protein HQM00_03310 [Magnetococcales bacterium]|nr:hypothetical protein [Magnetococcales bacterium]